MHERASKSGLFLMELIIVIMFFSLASAVTVQLFVKSHLVSRTTVALTNSTMIVQNYAEVFRNSNGDFSELLDFFQTEISHSDNNSFEVCYSADWESLKHSDSDGFILKGIYSEEDNFHYLLLSVYDNKAGQTVHEIEIEKYVRNGADS